MYVYSDHFIQHLHNQTMLNASDFRRFKMKGLDLWRKLLMESNCKYKQSLWCYGQHILNVLNLGNVCVQCFYKSINIYLGAHRKTIVFCFNKSNGFFLCASIVKRNKAGQFNGRLSNYLEFNSLYLVIFKVDKGDVSCLIFFFTHV